MSHYNELISLVLQTQNQLKLNKLDQNLISLFHISQTIWSTNFTFTSAEDQELSVFDVQQINLLKKIDLTVSFHIFEWVQFKLKLYSNLSQQHHLTFMFMMMNLLQKQQKHSILMYKKFITVLLRNVLHYVMNIQYCVEQDSRYESKSVLSLFKFIQTNLNQIEFFAF